MNIYDIAKEAGVSIATVSRVLNNKGTVSAATRARVEAILKQNNYTPSAIARGMVSKSMRTVAVLTVDIRVPHYARTAYTIEREFSRRGYEVILCNTGGDRAETLRYLQAVNQKQVDGIVLVSSKGEPMKRESDLIDVWFDSGAMPYAQIHYPFENKELLDNRQVYPADFIAEGVDQTRGWFFTLHAIATMVFDSVSYKAVISNGLVLDKNGNKMSKRLNNAVDPFTTIEKYGSDPLRWYMITNSSPWDNLKFDVEGVEEVRRKFFGTLYNTYSFFALYANVDGFEYKEADVPMAERPEIDRWILSVLNTLIKEVDTCYNEYEPTKAGRLISDFVNDNLSNWYVRLNRKRFWGGEFTQDKLSAYQTLYTCLETVAKLMAPVSPFYADRLYTDLITATGRDNVVSVHLAEFPKYQEEMIDKELEARMQMAQDVTSMVLALRRKVNIKVRQPLQCIMVPVVDEEQKAHIEAVKNLIMNEVNVKEVRFVDGAAGVLVKKVKCDFKKLGPKFGKQMKAVAAAVAEMSQEAIGELEKNVPAILLSASGSQELGHGIADVLTGKAAAAGRLNMTWYRSDEDLPDMNDYDIIQGKRTYQYFDREVLYPFEYGLTYAAFSYEKMQIKKERGCIKVSCFIKNTGERSADEVVQLYVHKKGSRVQRPIRQLVGFERIHDIQPKETRKVTFMVQLWELEYYDVISERMILEEGTYQFMAGASSQDIRLEQSIEIDGTHAGKRNPFQATAADCYDAYDHMFLHRGINGSSCVIPGCAGDDPDEMKKQPVSGKLIYHDFVFSKKPLRLNITLKVLEPVKVTVTGKNVATVTAEPVDCYRMLEMDLPENFIETGKPETIQIQVEGKCKISKFVFA